MEFLTKLFSTFLFLSVITGLTQEWFLYDKNLPFHYELLFRLSKILFPISLILTILIAFYGFWQL